MDTSDSQFTQLVREYKSTIYTVCFMFSSDTDEVNDLFQQSLINIWKGLKEFREQSSLKSWIWRVSLNTCLSAERRRKSQRNEPLTDMDLFREARSEDDRQIKQLYSRIYRLKPFDRAIVLLWLESLSYDEIAAIVGISVKNVSVRLYRIKEELKRMSD